MVLWDFDKQNWKEKRRGRLERHWAGAEVALKWSSGEKRKNCALGSHGGWERGGGWAKRYPLSWLRNAGKEPKLWWHNTWLLNSVLLNQHHSLRLQHEPQLCRHYVCKARWGKTADQDRGKAETCLFAFLCVKFPFFALTRLLCSLLGVSAPLRLWLAYGLLWPPVASLWPFSRMMTILLEFLLWNVSLYSCFLVQKSLSHN